MESLKTILNQYKNGNISEEQAIGIIMDLFSNRNICIPYWPQITYYETFPKYEVTCNVRE